MVYYNMSFKELRNRVKFALRHAKNDFFKEKLTSLQSNPSAFWKVINHLSGRQRVANTQLPSVSSLSKHFSSVVGSVDSDHDSTSSLSCLSLFTALDFTRFPRVSEDDVLTLLRGLNPSKASGLDEIGIASSLSSLFNNSLSTGVFPEDWKCAKVSPVYKSGPRSDPANYRPVSLLLIISKVLEEFVFRSLSCYFEDNALLPDCQFGFRRNRSTQDAASILACDLAKSKDNGSWSGSVFLDVRKAFDTVDHDLLLRKLSLKGVNGIALKWLTSYLSNRFQVVQVAGCSSRKCQIRRGVPQGSKLGPLLFNFFTGGLPDCISNRSSIILYADDACIYSSQNSNSEVKVLSVLQSEVDSVSNWYKENFMSLNGRKSDFVIYPPFRKKSAGSPSIRIGSEVVPSASSARYLGIIFDSNLCWKDHVSSVMSKAGRNLGMFYRCHRLLSEKARLALVKSVIQPGLDYGSVVWSNGSAGIQSRLLRIEKRVLEDLTYRDRTDAAGGLKHLFSKYRLRSYSSRHCSQLGQFAHRALFSASSPLIGRFFKAISNYNYGTRLSSSGVCVDRPRTEAWKKSTAYRAQKLWNSLPADLREIKDLAAFKIRLKFL